MDNVRQLRSDDSITNLLDVVRRNENPVPWAEGDNIPWGEPEFSRRMLREHLSQEHNAASRSCDIIDKHIDWIHSYLLSGKSSKILDLGCGLGLYSSRLARLGHECVGIDYSPASVEYAVSESAREQLTCTYSQQDIRKAEYGSGYDLVMLIFGEFNVFRPEDAKLILDKAYDALKGGGTLLLEAHTFDAIKKMGEQTPSWYASQGGLFSVRPHICMIEGYWDDALIAATKRYFIVDALTGEVSRYAQSLQAYDERDYTKVLSGCGFGDVKAYPSLTGDENSMTEGLFVLAASKEVV